MGLWHHYGMITITYPSSSSIFCASLFGVRLICMTVGYGSWQISRQSSLGASLQLLRDIDGICHTLQPNLLLFPPQEKMLCLLSIPYNEWLLMKQNAKSAIALHPIPSSWKLPPLVTVVHSFDVSHAPQNLRVITIHDESSN